MAQAGRRADRGRRGALRGFDGKGGLRGAFAGQRHSERDPGTRGADRPGWHQAGGCDGCRRGCRAATCSRATCSPATCSRAVPGLRGAASRPRGTGDRAPVPGCSLRGQASGWERSCAGPPSRRSSGPLGRTDQAAFWWPGPSRAPPGRPAAPHSTPPGGAQPAPVPCGQAPHCRARARPGPDPGHRGRWQDHARRRAGGGGTPRGRWPGRSCRRPGRGRDGPGGRRPAGLRPSSHVGRGTCAPGGRA